MNILVTGCNRGLGLCLIKSLLNHEEAPAHIFATCRDIEKAPDLVNLAKEHESSLHILEIDLRRYCDFPHMAEKICDVVGGEGLNAIINNAAVFQKHHRIENIKLDDFIDAFEVNSIAPIMLVHVCLIILKRAALNMKNAVMSFQRAAIVFIGSEIGSIAMNENGGDYALRASKAALNVYMRSLKRDLCIYDILCVTVCPGAIRTAAGGGMNAPLKTQDSADQIIDLLYKMDNTHNGGCFLYNGEQLPW